MLNKLVSEVKLGELKSYEYNDSPNIEVSKDPFASFVDTAGTKSTGSKNMRFRDSVHHI